MTGRGRGSGAEILLDFACTRWAQDGLAWVRKTDPRTMVDDHGQPFFVAGGLPDYIGFLGPAAQQLCTGRGILFDVKSTRKATWSWTSGRRRTKERQLQDIADAARFNVLAGLVVLFWAVEPLAGVNARVVCIPWWHVAQVASGTWSEEDLADLTGQLPRSVDGIIHGLIDLEASRETRSAAR